MDQKDTISEANNGEPGENSIPSANGTNSLVNSFSHFSSQFMAVVKTAEQQAPGVMGRVSCSDFAAILHSLDMAAFSRNARANWRVNPPASTVSMLLEKCVSNSLEALTRPSTARLPAASVTKKGGSGGTASSPVKGGKTGEKRRRRRRKAGTVSSSTRQSAKGSRRETDGSKVPKVATAAASSAGKSGEGEIKSAARKVRASFRSKEGAKAREELSSDLKGKGYPFHPLAGIADVRKLVALRLDHIRSNSKDQPSMPWIRRLGLVNKSDGSLALQDLADAGERGAGDASKQRSTPPSPKSAAAAAATSGVKADSVAETAPFVSEGSDTHRLATAPVPVNSGTKASAGDASTSGSTRRTKKVSDTRKLCRPEFQPVSLTTSLPYKPTKGSLGRVVESELRNSLEATLRPGRGAKSPSAADLEWLSCIGYMEGRSLKRVSTQHYRSSPLTYKVYIDFDGPEVFLALARPFFIEKPDESKETLKGKILLYGLAADTPEGKPSGSIASTKQIYRDSAISCEFAEFPIVTVVGSASAPPKDSGQAS